jgi:hypothetical protein
MDHVSKFRKQYTDDICVYLMFSFLAAREILECYFERIGTHVFLWLPDLFYVSDYAPQLIRCSICRALYRFDKPDVNTINFSTALLTTCPHSMIWFQWVSSYAFDPVSRQYFLWTQLYIWMHHPPVCMFSLFS